VAGEDRLYDPERVTLATAHAVERARSRGVAVIEPEDLLIGLLYAVSRFGIVPFGDAELDLQELGLRFDVCEPSQTFGPRYSEATAEVFDRAARVARLEGARRIVPIHFLAVLADQDLPLIGEIQRRYGLDSTRLRAALARVPVPAAAQVNAAPAASVGLLNPDEAAAFLGLHTQTIRGYIRSGRLPAFRVAGERSIRIRRDDLLALLESLDPDHGAAGPPARLPSRATET
jgi:excisionase family DNA binding protein